MSEKMYINGKNLSEYGGKLNYYWVTQSQEIDIEYYKGKNRTTPRILSMVNGTSEIDLTICFFAETRNDALRNRSLFERDLYKSMEVYMPDELYYSVVKIDKKAKKFIGNVGIEMDYTIKAIAHGEKISARAQTVECLSTVQQTDCVIGSIIGGLPPAAVDAVDSVTVFYSAGGAGGDTLTWDGNTEGLEAVDLLGNGSMVLYRVSDATPTLEEAQAGGTINGAGGFSSEFTSNEIIAPTANIYAIINVDFATISLVDNADLFGVTIPKKGVYFTNGENRCASLTINGYTGFGGGGVPAQPETLTPSEDWSVTRPDAEAVFYTVRTVYKDGRFEYTVPTEYAPAAAEYTITVNDNSIVFGNEWYTPQIGDFLVWDGVDGRVLVNGAPAAHWASFLRLPYLEQGFNTITAPDGATVDYSPTYL